MSDPVNSSETGTPSPSMTARIAETARLLKGKFSPEGMDRADSLLQGYPNPCRVVHVLQLLHNVMFPGKWDPETVPYNQL
ncbi:MAG: hypothetical protein KDL10_02180, partial [Kiritimatiellae bacterium]|nr:hypothetical protein [Kiritimatiellia bacterium]